MRYKVQGFTLVELMVVVAVVAILAAIALPSYQNHVVKTNRTAAGACLSELAQFMERTYTENMTYNPNNFQLPALQCRNDLLARYTFSISGLAARTYTLTATPTTLQKDTDCGSLTINHTGLRGAKGGTDPAVVRTCW
jgi:type IV pilus assembly protein PilE